MTTPLQTLTNSEAENLYKTLWSWPDCCGCFSISHCTNESCSWQRSLRLSPYLEYYKEITASYAPDVDSENHTTLTSHHELLAIIKLIKSNPHLPKKLLISKISPEPTNKKHILNIDASINLTVEAFLMISCSAQREFVHHLERGLTRTAWYKDQTLGEFLTVAFPLTNNTINNSRPGERVSDLTRTVTAARLKKHAHLKFKPTDDLRNHLRLNLVRDTVEIFHHTAFLKEHLRLTKDHPRDESFEECLKYGALPRQLALEVLDSIQKVLFPLSDPESYNLLLSFVSSLGFDPDCTYLESITIRAEDEKDISYQYFGARLAALLEELENPRPRNWIEHWAEQKSGARYVLMATLVGVVIAILLGIMSLAVESYAAWISYQQWKHPN